ncbi:MAG: hypothetical protein RL173_1255 [Fibrobacterota bacterium]|jgi:hypothetical protein
MFIPLLASLFLSNPDTLASAEDPLPETNSMAVYIHPVAPLIAAYERGFAYLFAVTVEKEIPKARSLVLQLQVGTRNWGSDKATYDQPEPDFFHHTSWAIRGSLRSYVNGFRHEGLYLAGSTELSHLNTVTEKTSELSDYLAVMGYAGFRSKATHFTFYADVGLGLVLIGSYSKETVGSGNVEKSLYDIGGNFGVGYPF